MGRYVAICTLLEYLLLDQSLTCYQGANVFGGFVIFYWICVPAIYYTNTWFTSYLPVMSSGTFDRTGGPYDVTKVLGPTGALDEAAYAAYSPIYLSASFALRYGLSFASITALPVHVLLYHGRDILDVFKGRGKKDIHARLMVNYRTTPMWWYAALTLCFFILSIVMVEVYDIGLPWWGVVLAMLIPAFYVIPCGLIQGITNISANQLNVLSEFIGGYVFAGKPLANMAFKILSEDVVGQALTFAADMKLGHYMKISPRLVFFAQGGAAVSLPRTSMWASVRGFLTWRKPTLGPRRTGQHWRQCVGLVACRWRMC